MGEAVKTQDLFIRWMIRRDMDQVLDIENACFEYPCTEDEIVEFLRSRNGIGVVAEYRDEVIGFVLYRVYKSHMRIEDIAVRPDFQRSKVGTEMVNQLKGRLDFAGRTRIETVVMERNLRAQKFFSGHGFRVEEMMKGFYTEIPDDAYRFVFRLHPESQSQRAMVSAGNRISREVERCQ